MKATEQYFPVLLLIMLYKVFLTFESVDEIIKCDHSDESYWAVLSCDTVYYALQDGWIFEWNKSCGDVLSVADVVFNLTEVYDVVSFEH